MAGSAGVAQENGATTYELRVMGPLPSLASRWLKDLQVEALPNGDARLCVCVPDSAALYGLLGRLRDLGLVLLTLSRHERDADARSGR